MDLPLQYDKDAVMNLVVEDGLNLRHACATIRNDRETVMAAVLQDGLALQYASAEMRADRYVALAAASQDGAALQFASAPLRADPVLQRLANLRKRTDTRLAPTPGQIRHTARQPLGPPQPPVVAAVAAAAATATAAVAATHGELHAAVRDTEVGSNFDLVTTAAQPTACPGSHCLFNRYTGGGGCDGCGARVPAGARVMDCRLCDWFLCTECDASSMRGAYRRYDRAEPDLHSYYTAPEQYTPPPKPPGRSGPGTAAQVAARAAAAAAAEAAMGPAARGWAALVRDCATAAGRSASNVGGQCRGPASTQRL